MLIDAGDFVISDHAEQRVRQRIGVPRRAVARTVRRAWQQGLTHDQDPNRCIITGIGGEGMRVVRIYGGFVFVFATEGLSKPQLVTVLNYHGDRQRKRRSKGSD